MITLYGVPRSRAVRCLWMLEELGVPYRNVPTHFASGDTRTAEFLRLNPNGHIPVLQDDDVILWESMAINLYLARRYDRHGLWPTRVEDEGRVYQWSIWVMTEVEEPLVTALVNRVVLPAAQRDEARAVAAGERFRKPLAVLDGALAGRRHLVGDAFTVADLNVAAVLSWAPMAGFDLSPAPNVQAWLQPCLARPALARATQQG